MRSNKMEGAASSGLRRFYLVVNLASLVNNGRWDLAWRFLWDIDISWLERKVSANRNIIMN